MSRSEEGLWNIPPSWQWVTMGQVAGVVGGGTPDTKHSANFGGPIPWITPADMSSHVGKLINGGARSISQQGLVGSGAKWLPRGAVLFSSRAPIGYAAVAARPVTTNQGFKSFVPYGNIDSDYVYHWLTGAKQQAEKLASGTTFLEISGAKAALIPFPLAPLGEQTRIVEKLEELLSDLDTGVAELKAAQHKLAQYRQSLLKAAVEGVLTADWRAARCQTSKPQETGAELLQRILIERRARWEAKQLAKFAEQGKTPKGWQGKYKEPVAPDTADLPKLPKGWVWACIDQIAEVFLGKMLDKTKHISGKKIPYLRNINVRWGSIEIDDVYEMFFDLDEMERFGLVAGDVLVCEGGEPGRASICTKEHEGFKYQKALHRVRLFNLYEPELLVAFLEFVAKTGRLAKAFTGSTINHFTKESFLALHIPLPSIGEQRMIVDSITAGISNISEQESAIELSLKQAAAQRKNILKAAFAGQLVPQDPNDEPASILLERIRAERAAQSNTGKKRGHSLRKTA